MPIKRDQNKVIQKTIEGATRERGVIKDPERRPINFLPETEPANFRLNNINYSGILFNQEQLLGGFDVASATDYGIVSVNDVTGSTGTVVALGTFTDTSQSWTTDEWADYHFIGVNGTFRIKSNTDTVITFHDTGANPGAGGYSIVPYKANSLVGKFLMPDSSVPAKFRIASNTQYAIDCDEELVDVYTGEITGATLAAGTNLTQYEYQEYVDWKIFFVDGDASGETGTVTVYASGDGSMTVTGLTGVPASGDTFIMQANLSSFTFSEAYVAGMYDLYDGTFDDVEWENLQQTSLISVDGDFRLNQSVAGYNSRYTVEYYSEKPVAIPIAIDFSGSVRIDVNGNPQATNVIDGALSFQPGWNRVDIYFYSPDGGSLYVTGKTKPIGWYFTMWKDPTPGAPAWVSTSGYSGVVAQEGRVELNWSNTSLLGPNGGTEIWYQASGDSSFTFVDRLPQETQTFIHSGLNADTTYIYKLRHFTSQGDLSDFSTERQSSTAPDVVADGSVLVVDVTDSDDYYKSGDTVNFTVTSPVGLSAQPSATVGASGATYVSGSVDGLYTKTVWTYTVTGTETEGVVEISASGTTVGGTAVTGTKDIAFDFVAPVITTDDLTLDADDSPNNGALLYTSLPTRVFLHPGLELADTSGASGWASGLFYTRVQNAFRGTGSSAASGYMIDANLPWAQASGVTWTGYILRDSGGTEHTISGAQASGDNTRFNMSGTPVNGEYNIYKYTNTLTSSSNYRQYSYVASAPIQWDLTIDMPYSLSTMPGELTPENQFVVFACVVDRSGNVSNILDQEIHYNALASSLPIITHDFISSGSPVQPNENGWYSSTTLYLRVTAEAPAEGMEVDEIYYRIDGGAWSSSSIGAASGYVDIALSESTQSYVDYYATTTGLANVGSMQTVPFKYDKTVPTWTPSGKSVVGRWESIELGWTNDPADSGSGVEKIKVYRADSDVSANAVIIGEILDGARGFVDTTAVVGTTYYYWIRAVDYAGNHMSAIDMTLGTGVQVDGVIVTSKFMSGSGEVVANEDGWINDSSAFLRVTATTINGVTDIENIYVNISGAGWNASGSAATTINVDVPLVEEIGNIQFYAQTAGMVSATFRQDYQYDATAPSWTPGTLSGTGGFERIILGWASGATDALSGIKGYQILRHTADASGSATQIAFLEGEFLGYIDAEVDYDTNYYYWAKAVDYAGNIGVIKDMGGPLTATKIEPADVDGALRIQNPYNTPSGDTDWEVRYGIRVPIEAATIQTATLSAVTEISGIDYSTDGSSWTGVTNPEVNGDSISFPFTLSSDTKHTITFDPVQTGNYWRVVFDGTVGSEISAVDFNSILAADLIVAGVLRLETGLSVWSGSHTSGVRSGSGVSIDSAGIRLWNATGGTEVALYGVASGGNVAVLGSVSGRQVFVTSNGDVQIEGGALLIGSGINQVLNSDFEGGETYWTFNTKPNGTWTIVSDEQYFNDYSAYIEVDGSGSNSVNLETDFIEIDLDKVYLISAYTKIASHVGGKVRVVCRQYDSSKAYLAVDTMWNSDVASHDWKRDYNHIDSDKIHASTKYIKVRFTQVVDGGNPEFETWVDGVQVEEADHDDQVPSEWRPGGFTVIDGGIITTGKIESTDGKTFFDLDNNEIVLQDSTGGTAVHMQGGATGSNDIMTLGATVGQQVRVDASGNTIIDGELVVGQVRSANYGLDTGTEIDLDSGTAHFGGSGGAESIEFDASGNIISQTYLVERSRLFGAGDDATGTVTLSTTGSTPVVSDDDGENIFVRSGTTWTMQRDVYVTNLTVGTATTLETNGYRIFVKQTFTVNGGAVVQNSGSDGTLGSSPGAEGTGGAGGAGGSLSAGQDGGDGGAGGTGGGVVEGGGGGGAGGTGGIILIFARYVVNNGTIRAKGGDGGGGGDGDSV